MRPDIWERVKKIIMEQLDVKEEQLLPEVKLVEDLGADSLDIVEMIMMIEEKFKIEIPDSDAENLLTIKDVIDYLEKRLEKKE